MTGRWYFIYRMLCAFRLENISKAVNIKEVYYRYVTQGQVFQKVEIIRLVFFLFIVIHLFCPNSVVACFLDHNQ